MSLLLLLKSSGGAGTGSSAHLIDVLVKAVQTSLHHTDAKLQLGASASHAVDSVLRGVVTISHSTDATIKSTTTKLHATDVLLTAFTAVTHGVDVTLKSISSVNYAIAVLLTSSTTVTHSVQALISQSRTTISGLDAVLRLSSTTSHSVDIYVRPAPIQHQLDSILVLQVTKTHGVEAELTEHVTRSYFTDALLVIGSTTTRVITAPGKFNHEVFVNPGIPPFVPWWNKSYPFRRVVIVTAPPSGLPAGHPVRFKIDISSMETGQKIRNDRADYRIVDSNRRPVPSTILVDHVSFPLQRGLLPGAKDIYVMYYGSRQRAIGTTYEELRWPIVLDPSHPSITYKDPESQWSLDATPTSIMTSEAIITVNADSVKVLLGTSPDGSIIQVGDQFLSLYSELAGHKEVIFNDLNPETTTRISVKNMFGKLEILRVYLRSLPVAITQNEELVFNAFKVIRGI